MAVDKTKSTFHLSSTRVPATSMSVQFGLTDLLFSRRRKAWIFADFVLTFFMFNVGIWLSPFGKIGVWTEHYFISASIFSVVFCFVAAGLGYYDRIRRFGLVNTIFTGLLVTLMASLVVIAILYFSFYNVYGRWTLFYGSLGAYSATIAIRLPLRWVLRKFPYRYTVFGDSMALQEVLQHTNSDKKEASLYNYISWSELFPAGKNIDVAALINYKVGDIVVARDSMNDPILVDLALHAIHAGCRVIDEIEFYGHIFERVPIDQVSRAWLLAEGLDHRRRVFTDLIKRSFDVVAAFLGIIVCSPVLLLIALIIRLTSQGPVIFVQPRVGQFCQPFNMYKFRTMYIPKTGGDHSKDGFTAVNDPRVTAIGKIIRPLHFDELPQLFNILLGHMSIVGPRPETLNFATKVRKQIDLYDMRYLMRPGLTGHAQLHQGYAMDTVDDTKKKVSFDLYYLCKHSLTWDLRLILRTVFVLVRGAR